MYEIENVLDLRPTAEGGDNVKQGFDKIKAEEQKIYDAINAVDAAKAPQATTYTKTESDNLLTAKANQSTTYTKTENDNLLTAKANQSTTYTKTESDNFLTAKANQSTTYTKSEADTLLTAKANQLTTYTKAEADTLLGAKETPAGAQSKADAVQTNLTSHINDTTDAHMASAVGYAGDLTADNVEDALNELKSEKVAKGELVVNVKDFGAVGDGVTDNYAIIQSCIDNYNNILIPNGNYICSAPLIINRAGVTVSGSSDGMNSSCLIFDNTIGILVNSGYRLVTIKDLNITSNTYTFGGIEVSKHGGTEVDCHFLTVKRVMINRFKYPICIGRNSVTDLKDGVTFLWNCKFEDIKINSFYKTVDAVAIKVEGNGVTSFGIEFNRIYVNGVKTCAYLESINAKFTGCNFGINSASSIVATTVSNIEFDTCNFECDSHVTSVATYPALITSTLNTLFINCSFSTNVDANIAVIYGGTSSKFTFINNTWKAKTGDLMATFFQGALSSVKYSIIMAGGNSTIPRQNFGVFRSLQILDLERSITPQRANGADESATKYIGESTYNVLTKKPEWWSGTAWMEAHTKAVACADITTANANTQTATYVQTDVQTIATLVNALKVDIADLKAKLRTALLLS